MTRTPGLWTCGVHKLSEGYRLSDADACLIAAAPALLEACEALLEGDPNCGELARAAIALAKGEK